MTHVQHILQLRRKAQAATPPAQIVLPDLPGINRRERRMKISKEAQKREYNRILAECRKLAKNRRSAKGEKKRELGARLADVRKHMDGLLTLIGTYTTEEKLHGFKEGDHVF